MSLRRAAFDVDDCDVVDVEFWGCLRSGSCGYEERQQNDQKTLVGGEFHHQHFKVAGAKRQRVLRELLAMPVAVSRRYGVLRLRDCSASPSSLSAQDDSRGKLPEPKLGVQLLRLPNLLLRQWNISRVADRSIQKVDHCVGDAAGRV